MTKTKPEILLINPPIYDFTAYDFWLKPYGMLSVAGKLRSKANFKFFDYLDRQHPFVANKEKFKSDKWCRGKFYAEKIPAPPSLIDIPRSFYRFGLPRDIFTDFLKSTSLPDFAFIQTTMTYWYPGIVEVIADLRQIFPKTKIVLGGNYATICNSHARTLGADFILNGIDTEPLWQYLDIHPDLDQPPLWQVYEKPNVAVLRLTDGCPFKCTYCAAPEVYGQFKPRSLPNALAEMQLLKKLNVKNIAFYDDALLFNPEKILIPFLKEVISQNLKVNFHTPNALNARFITAELAKLLVRAGFKTFYLGLESNSPQWQKNTGSKIFADEFARAVTDLKSAGAEPSSIIAYQIIGHPHTDLQQLEDSMRFVNSLGIRSMLADFSPIPNTPDGCDCEKYVDLAEPLLHNKTAFPIILLGSDEVNRLKNLCRKLNHEI